MMNLKNTHPTGQNQKSSDSPSPERTSEHNKPCFLDHSSDGAHTHGLWCSGSLSTHHVFCCCVCARNFVAIAVHVPHDIPPPQTRARAASPRRRPALLPSGRRPRLFSTFLFYFPSFLPWRSFLPSFLPSFLGVPFLSSFLPSLTVLPYSFLP